MIESKSTDLIPRATVEQLVGHRDRALTLYKDGLALVDRINETSRSASPSGHRCAKIEIGLAHRGNSYGGTCLDDYRKHLDRACWSSLMDTCGLSDLMGAKQKAAFADGLERDVPEFTFENIRATFFSDAADPWEIVKQSVRDLFKVTPKNYKSNDAFKIGGRMILENAYEPVFRGWRRCSRPWCRYEYVHDLDKALHILDGKKHETRAVDLIANAMRARETEWEGPYFRVRWYDKGTVHIWFNRPDLVKRMNKIVAEEQPDGIAAA